MFRAKTSVGMILTAMASRSAQFHLTTTNEALSLTLIREAVFSGQPRSFCSSSSSPINQAQPQQQQQQQEQQPQPQPMQSSYESSTIRRRPYNVEAKMRMKAYRREAMQRQYAQEIEDEEKYFQIDHEAMYKKGDPGTVQGIIRDYSTVGYFVTLPNKREGFLACSQLGCSGGIPLLQRLYKVGDEITVRAEIVGDGGRDRLYTKKGS
ncbi:hypothetical protein GOP47_0012119 [Adiantum capillus-veneris]|uniref:S1 motif domain-containing protein n=1 Tax=Adiantum capillus-veneris TaxID=13818 RepID=A0A9D4UQ37_ADICA|nr:hypothetical protein GOP47_0012119 [Adiantum capillus-veneris]